MNKLTRGEQIATGGALVLLISLFLGYYTASFGGFGSISCSGLSCRPIIGYPLLLLALFIGGSIIAAKLGNVTLPSLPMSWRDAYFYGGIAAAVLWLLYFITKPGGFSWGIGLWVGLIGAAAAAFGGFTMRSEPDTGVAAPPLSAPPTGPPPGGPTV